MDKIYSRTKISIPRNVKKIKNKKKFIFIIFFLITIITSVKIMIDSVSPVFEKLSEDEAKSIATLVTNEKATEVMNKHNYEEMFTIEKDSSGNITMVKSNIYPINDIISDAARKIQEECCSFPMSARRWSVCPDIPDGGWSVYRKVEQRHGRTLG